MDTLVWPRGDSVDVEQRGRQMKEGDMPDSAREAKAAVRFALGDDTRQEDADAMAERLQQPADLMSDEQLAAAQRLAELEARRRYGNYPETNTNSETM